MGAARILIAEDEHGISSFLENGLRAAGFAATVVEDGSSALALARTGEFDLVVLDLGLPTRDGLSCSRSSGAPAIGCPSSSLPRARSSMTRSPASTVARTTT